MNAQEIKKSIEDIQKKLDNPDIPEKFKEIWREVLEKRIAQLQGLKVVDSDV